MTPRERAIAALNEADACETGDDAIAVIERAITAAVDAETERCAKVCEEKARILRLRASQYDEECVSAIRGDK